MCAALAAIVVLFLVLAFYLAARRRPRRYKYKLNRVFRPSGGVHHVAIAQTATPMPQLSEKTKATLTLTKGAHLAPGLAASVYAAAGVSETGTTVSLFLSAPLDTALDLRAPDIEGYLTLYP